MSYASLEVFRGRQVCGLKSNLGQNNQCTDSPGHFLVLALLVEYHRQRRLLHLRRKLQEHEQFALPEGFEIRVSGHCIQEMSEGTQEKAGYCTDLRIMLPGMATLKVCARPSVGSKMAVGLEVLTSFSVAFSALRLRFYTMLASAQVFYRTGKP